MMGGDLRSMNEFCEKLMLNKELLAINQDEEARLPYVAAGRPELKPNPGRRIPVGRAGADCADHDQHLSGGEFAIGLFNLSKSDAQISCISRTAACPTPPARL